MVSGIVSPRLKMLISTFLKEATYVDEEAKKLTNNFEAIQAVLADAEERQAGDKRVRLWLEKLKYASYDMEDVLDKWNTARLKLQIERIEENARVPQKKVFFFFPASCFGVKQVSLHSDVALKIKVINEKLDDINIEKDRFNFKVTELEIPERVVSIPVVDESEIYGREYEKKIIIIKLLSEISENQKGIDIISIVGEGGIGKTTLAQLSYNDERVTNHFDTRIWVTLSDTFDEFRIAKSIIEALEGSVPNLGELESLLQYISKSIVGKKFFLVLDDVWNEDYGKWEPFLHCLMNGLHGSKILITTRMESIAYMMQSTDVMSVMPMTNEESWSLFCQLAFSGRSPEECTVFEDIGRKIVGKCMGLPLAIKTIGSAMIFKRTVEEWEQILDSEMWEHYEQAILSCLWLSYNDLPYMARQCFSYCAIFPTDFQIEKDKLIKLWMAQGYLGMGEGEEMEIIGEEYFDLLATRAFFQDFEKDDNGVIVRCQMHDLVHDFAQYLARCEGLMMTVSNGLQEIIFHHYKRRYRMLILDEEVSFPVLSGAEKVRSLFIHCEVTNCSSDSVVLLKLLSQLTSLRALDLSGQLWCRSVIIKIPREIGKLILLRYLNLSSLKIIELPEELCELFNLQTLELSWCTNLKKLPEGMGKLINLRHFVNIETSLSYMSRGIERLANLQTLNEFVVCSGSDDSKACTLACLKNMNHLRGSLSIKNLGSVADFSEIEEANLQSKREIIRLHLNFENEAEEFWMNKDDKSKVFTDERVLEAFKPPPNLEFLEIRGYKGNTRFLDFIMSLSQLRTLNLHNCMYLDHLPSLGKLQFLESLSISGMRCVRVGNELLGTRSDGASSSSSVIAFPRLESLKFVNMEEWEDWDCRTIMPCLRSLSLVHCPKLKALPNHILQTTMLKELMINWCPILEERYNKTRDHWHVISHVPNIMINFDYVPRGGA